MRTGIQLILSGIMLLGLISCSKDNDDDKVKTKAELLSAHTWIYNEYFTNYNQTNTALVYKKGKSNNLINLAGDEITFKADGTFSRIDLMGQPKSGTWQLVSNDTQLSTVEGGVTHTSNIIVLDGNNFTFHDVPENVYAEMIPK